MDDRSLLGLAANLAERAGAEIRAIRDRGFKVQHKPDRSVVTEADHAAEAIIVAGLRQALPGCTVVAEEEAAGGKISVATPEFWLVDPLDGTREFTSGGDDFAVNIGLVRDGKAVLGVVAVPATGEIFSGIVGAGAWRDKGGQRTPIATRRPPPEGLTVVASRHHGDQAQLDAFLAGRKVAGIVNFGSSLKFCRLAEGLADLYPRFGRTMEWDTCAPHAVLEAAGGWVGTLDDQPLRYGKPGWDNPHFVCWGALPAPGG
jgi:3'(2'), 5'-bisphosphate nucleotidase